MVGGREVFIFIDLNLATVNLRRENLKFNYRHGTLDDLAAVYDVFTQTTADLERRMGTPDERNIWIDPDFIENYWRRRRSLFEHITNTAEYFWVAENDGLVIGYARTTNHDGVRELIDYYVLPRFQSGGIGGELLGRAFPSGGARLRALIGTTDIRALARYLKAGVTPRFPVYYIFKQPETVEVETDLIFKTAKFDPETLAAIREIDKAILGFERDADHEFLLRDRQPYLFYRGQQVVGYGYFGNGTGPIALMHASDFPAVLARGETEAAARNEDEFGMQIPLINQSAVGYLLERGYRFEDFTALFMSDEAFGKFENYIFTSPPFFF
jgi:ribosomal protein S18 acetylase RimI-like enzyme